MENSGSATLNCALKMLLRLRRKILIFSLLWTHTYFSLSSVSKLKQLLEHDFHSKIIKFLRRLSEQIRWHRSADSSIYQGSLEPKSFWSKTNSRDGVTSHAWGFTLVVFLLQWATLATFDYSSWWRTTPSLVGLCVWRKSKLGSTGSCFNVGSRQIAFHSQWKS